MRLKIHICLLIISMLIFSLLFSSEVKGQKRSDRNKKYVSAELTVINDQGNPIENSLVAAGGLACGFSGMNGKILIECPENDLVTISKTGYEDIKIRMNELVENPVIRLEKKGFLLSDADNIPMPFMIIKKRYSTSGAFLIRGNELEKYPTIDIRNSLTGLAPGLRVQEMNGAPGMQAEEKMGWFGISDKIRLSVRGRSPLFIIDDVPTDVTEVQIEQTEIGSVTVIKDICGKAMYGPMAADGIIFIRTKRGTQDQRLLKVNAESGISYVDRFPKMTLGSEYAALNNLARSNSGIDPLYSPNDIAAFSKNDPYDMFHPSINYRELMLKDSKNIRKLNVAYEGGDQNVRFFSNIGYGGEDDIYKIGSTADYNRLNFRSNLDITISELLSAKINLFGGLTIRRSPNYGYDPQYGSDASTDATLDILEFNSLISDINTISPVAFPVYANYDKAENVYWFGVDPAFPNNPIGRLTDNGYYTEYGRTGASNITLDYDMKKIIKGLKSSTFFNFDIYNLLRIGKAENYIAYNVIPSKTTSGADTILLTKAHDGVDMAGQAKLHDYYYQRLGGFQNFSFDKAIGSNSFLQSSLTFILSRVTRDQIKEPQRQQNVVLSALFSHKEKYSVQGVLNYAGSSSLPPGNRFSLFPSLGVGWILSEENFLSDLSFLNFFKLRGEAGLLGYEPFNDPFLYQDNWTYNTTGGSTGASPTGYWFGSDLVSTLRSNISRIGNPDIGWEQRREISFGMDALMFDNKLAVEVTYFNNLRKGILTNLSYVVPYTSGKTFAGYYNNYNDIRYSGVEWNLTYSGKVGNLKYTAGGNASIQNSKILKYDEPNYRFAYQSRIGQPADAYRGLTTLGKFTSDAETENVPQLFDETLKAGDLKYKDLNADGVIDNNDVRMIGHTSPHLSYALNLRLSYRNFDLTIIADGISGVDLPLTNSYFHNGWGDGVYSEFVRDNIGGAYPRLSYYQVSNNFQASDFWLTKGDYFKIQNMELAYSLAPGAARKLNARGVKFFVRGANLLTITDVKYVDPESLDSGVEMYPLFRTFTAGLNFTF